MEVESNSKRKKSFSSTCCCNLIKFIFYILTLIILLELQSSSQWQLIPFITTTFSRNYSVSPATTTTISPVFLPLKDLEYTGGAMNGNTWFMSSLNDTVQGDESEYLHFKGNTVLCIKGRNTRDGTQNFYALASNSPKESLPEAATLLKGLTFVSNTYYDYGNLWHGLTAMMPFIGWSMNNKCAKPSRWVLFHWAELRLGTGRWLQDLMEANFGRMVIETFEGEEGSSYCFEEAVVMRHDLGRMGKDKKIMVSELLRCKARQSCGLLINNNNKNEIVIRMTLLMRKGPRSFKNETIIFNVFNDECRKVNGCQLKIVHSDPDQTFCDQVKMMTETDIVVSPHGAQLTNMLFMDKGSSVMEFFPRGWREYAGAGQYAHHWMAALSGMNHQGAWWDPLGDTDDCPVQYKDHHQCFSNYYKNGQVGHNQTYFAEWARDVLHRVRQTKLQQQQLLAQQSNNINACVC